MSRAGFLPFTLLAALALGVGIGCTGTLTVEKGPAGGDDDDDDDDSAPRADGGVNPGDPDAGAQPPADAAPDPPPDANPALSAQEQELFETINAERVGLGLTAVELRPDLICAAARHSADIGETRSCTHTGSDGSSPGDRVAGCPGGAGWSGEIVACGQSTPRSAVDAWIGSPGHNAIMFDSGQRYIGVAVHNNYWTAIFDR